MTLSETHVAPATSSPPNGVWRPLLRARLHGRAEPLFVTAQGLRSAASLWSGAQVWAQLLRTQADGARVVVWQTERLALLQLLVAMLWDGRTLQIETASGAAGPGEGVWCLDGRQVLHGGQTVCRVGDGGWPDLPGPTRMSPLDMLRFAPSSGEIGVLGRQISHGDLWLALGAPLGPPRAEPTATALPASDGEPQVLTPFSLAGLRTPNDVMNDALLPLLRHGEVWEHEALPTQIDATKKIGLAPFES